MSVKCPRARAAVEIPLRFRSIFSLLVHTELTHWIQLRRPKTPEEEEKKTKKIQIYWIVRRIHSHQKRKQSEWCGGCWRVGSSVHGCSARERVHAKSSPNNTQFTHTHMNSIDLLKYARANEKELNKSILFSFYFMTSRTACRMHPQHPQHPRSQINSERKRTKKNGGNLKQ